PAPSSEWRSVSYTFAAKAPPRRRRNGALSRTHRRKGALEPGGADEKSESAPVRRATPHIAADDRLGGTTVCGLSEPRGAPAGDSARSIARVSASVVYGFTSQVSPRATACSARSLGAWPLATMARCSGK